MEKLSGYAFIAAMLSTGLATIFYLLYAVSGLRAARMETAGMPVSSGPVGYISGPRTAEVGRYATILAWLATIFLLAALVFRTIKTGHGPFANMYEFSMAFSFGILIAYLYFEHKYHQRILALVSMPVALGMMLYAGWASLTGGAEITPLIPALQNSLLLTVHVATAIVAYGSFAIAFAASYLYLLQTESAFTVVLATVVGILAAVVGAITGGAPNALGYGMVATLGILLAMALVNRLAAGRSGESAVSSEAVGGRWGLPKPQVLDEIGYRAVVVGFPFLTLTIILGAVWAQTAWGTYWSWDPKETASLFTWLIYGAYLHARVMRGWRGSRAAWLLVLGFLATLLTYFGNLIFNGLHSYSGLG
jgi:cytochrome c-type biogenesis protein CcsB